MVEILFSELRFMTALNMDIQIEELRKTFLQELDCKGSNEIHPKDLHRVKTDNDWLKRFLLHHENDQKQAFNMMWEALTWRKEYGTNEINETNVKMDILVAGGFFPHGHDKDGCSLFIFKCKKYVRGAYDTEEIKRCVIYWMERLERQDRGKPITIFFDMENCGLSNLDMEFIKYLIGLFKQYYPYFLNYILIFEMPWILSAAFKVIKTWLPEQAVQKIKFVNKKDIKEFVPLDQALTCWGGNNDYIFSFLPEVQEVPLILTPPNNKKVHFADGSSMSEAGGNSGEKEHDREKEHDHTILTVYPSSIITFIREGNESVSTLELHNVDSSIILSYKFKTTSPEKFRVRPSAGCLGPGAHVIITVSLLPGYMVGSSLSRDKFLVMSMPVEREDLSSQELTELWKNASNRKISQHHLKCAIKSDVNKNGSAVSVGETSLENDQVNLHQLSPKLTQLADFQIKLHNALQTTQYFQIVTIVLIILLGVILVYVLYIEKHVGYNNTYCENPMAS